MKNKKFLFTAIAVALSLVFAVGCAKSDSLSVAKKKYDAVITVIDDYVIALEKGKTYLFENGKKVVNDGFKEIKPIAKYSQSQGGTEYVTDGFIVRREGSSEFCILDTSSLNVYSYGSDVVDVKLAVKETGVASYEPCGYLFTHSDGKKSVGNVGTSGQSDKFDSAKFENGYLITNTYAQGGSVSLRDSFFSPFATVEKSANGNITTVTDSTGISYSAVAVVDRGTAVQDVERYVIFGPGGKIDSADSVAVSIGAGYFTYEKGGSKYIINPDYSNTVNNDYQYPLISTPDGKCLILEQNSEGKQRAKELSGGKTTAWFDEIGR